MSREPIGSITPLEWRQVLDVARKLDLEQGGYWEARSGCVNLWCGPDDKPPGWPAELEIRRGGLGYPRAFVASISPEWPRDGSLDWSDRETQYAVVADVTLYEIDELHGGRYDPRYLRCEGDLEWVCGKWVPLLEAARSRVPKPLELRLGRTQGTCLSCSSSLHVIVEVLSSPWDNGVGDWQHYCPRCKTLTVPREQIDFFQRSGDGTIGHVLGVRA